MATDCENLFGDGNASSYQTIMVCPFCPGEPSVAWILVVDINKCAIGEATVTGRSNGLEYILVPVVCRSCRLRAIESMSAGEMSYQQWVDRLDRGVRYCEFSRRCDAVTTQMCSMLNKLAVIPCSIDDCDEDSVAIYSYVELRRAFDEDTVYELGFETRRHGAIAFSMRRRSREMMDAFYMM